MMSDIEDSGEEEVKGVEEVKRCSSLHEWETYDMPSWVTTGKLRGRACGKCKLVFLASKKQGSGYYVGLRTPVYECRRCNIVVCKICKPLTEESKTPEKPRTRRNERLDS
jgi:hypothetical protein